MLNTKIMNATVFRHRCLSAAAVANAPSIRQRQETRTKLFLNQNDRIIVASIMQTFRTVSV